MAAAGGQASWLTLALEELRVFGSFEELGAYVAKLAALSGDALIAESVARLGREVPGAAALLPLLAHSRYGVSFLPLKLLPLEFLEP